ncbi:MAG: HAD family hydrolase [bacterium]
MLENIKTIFFDFDGTIHDSSRIYVPSFRKAYNYLVKEGYSKEREWSKEQIIYWLGFTSVEMWNNFMPDLDEKVRAKASRIIGKEMLEQLSMGYGHLYDGALEVLQYLKEKGYSLIFLSNCGTSYKKKVNEVFELDKYFSDLICSEDYNFIPKHIIMNNIINNYPKEMIMVGDRIHDIETGKQNNIITIGCTYGYGNEKELQEADYKINSIRKLKELV